MDVVWFSELDMAAWQESGILITAPKAKKKREWTAKITGALAGALLATAACATQTMPAMVPYVPALQMQLWEESYPFQHVRETLKQLTNLGDDWNGRGARAPIAESVRATERVLEQLPFNVEPKVGVDGDGFVYLHFKSNERHAYLTMEPAVAHLVMIGKGDSPEFISEQPLKNSALPRIIVKKLAETF